MSAVPGSMRHSIAAQKFFRVEVPTWASGGQDVTADTPEEAALLVGCQHAAMGFLRGVALRARVLRHLSGSRIGATIMEECGVFPTLTADHYAI